MALASGVESALGSEEALGTLWEMESEGGSESKLAGVTERA